MKRSFSRLAVRSLVTRAAAAAFVCMLAACTSSSSSPTAPAGGTGVTVSGHPDWPPIMFQQGNIIDGAGPALVRRILDDLHLSASFPMTGTWDEVQAKARSGQVDMLVAAYKTTARLEYMLYSDAYTTDPVAIYVAKGKAFPFDTWDILIGKRGVAMVGDSYGQAFDDFAAAHLNLSRVSSSADAYDMLTNGQADYFINSLYAGDDQLKKSGTASRFESLPTFVSEENFYITISKQSPYVGYLPQINQLLAKYKADGTVDALIAYYKSH
jgi:polar amino acid transport system substrate-binding protein